ncbi:MAG: hypothetical protein ABFR63_12550 [Thermodesulfobacteriota bacterium]
MRKHEISFQILIIINFLILLGLLFLPPTAKATGKDDLYSIPFPSEFTPALLANGSPRYVSTGDIEKTIRSESRMFKKLYHNKRINRFIVPRHAWLDELMLSFHTTLRITGVHGKLETWDCENYSGLLNALATIRIWRAGFYDTRGAIGWMRVDARKEWAGIPAQLHALMFAVTDDGVFVIEPQNGETTELKNYPNKSYIEEAYLF